MASSMTFQPTTLLLAMSFYILGANYVPPCASPQYVKFGGVGVLHCTFSDEFFGIFWYDTTDYINSFSIVNLKGSSKSGSGFLSGEFDVHLNGSLIIANVSLQHDRQFTVLKFNSPSDDPKPCYIQVIVVVVPKPPYPLIENCSRPTNVCFKEVNSSFDLKCSVNSARPAVNVGFRKMTASGYESIFYNTSVKHQNALFTSFSTLLLTLNNTNFLELFACKAEGPPIMLENTEATVLVQSETVTELSIPVARKYIKLHSTLELGCSDKYVAFLVWKNSTCFQGVFHNLAYGVFSGEEFQYSYFNGFQVEENGILTISKLQIQHEGFYTCFFSDGVVDGVKSYEILAIVHPVPAFPVVDGCNQEEICELNLESEGKLNCSVLGVRPRVSLGWRTANKRSSAYITFGEEQTNVINHGNTFDVFLTSNYRIIDFSLNRIILECVVTGVNKELFPLKTEVSIAFTSSPTNGIQTEEPKDKAKKRNLMQKKRWLWIIIFTFVPFGLVIYVLYISKATRNSKCGITKNRSTDPEDFDLGKHQTQQARFLSKTSSLHLSIPLLGKDLAEMKAIFLKQLQTNYEILYNGIKPIPYVLDHMCCVETVFVEGGIQYLDNEQGYNSVRRWKNLETYASLLMSDNARFNSTRRILEADPGYGKTTTSLQIAYDWCNPEKRPYWNHDKILILLRLRQLRGVTSIYEAIRKFILPIDSTLEVDDIKTILQQDMSSVFFVLDGYDEYPDQKSSRKTDVMHILTCSLFQQSTVILTTRKFCLPKMYDPRSVRMRLTGFNEEAHKRYIRKAVVGSNVTAMEDIVSSIRENPLLDSLCQIPLFFVMIAHIIHHEKIDFQFASVTRFFQYLIKCFHAHMKDKLEDENVASNGNYEKKKNGHDKTLENLAYKGLSGKTQRSAWNKLDLSEKYGEDFIEFYERVGFFVLEQVATNERDTEIRFHHKLFGEWFAANYIAHNIPKERSMSFKPLFKNMDPTDLQFVYRFVCGLAPSAAPKIIQYLANAYNDIAVLCLLEVPLNEKGKDGELEKVLTKLCTPIITFKKDDNQLLQRAYLHLLDCASKNKVIVPFILLYESFNHVNRQSDCFKVVLKTGLSLPTLKHVVKIEINEDGKVITPDEAKDLVYYANSCEHLQTIKLVYCLLPFHIDVGKLPSTKQFEVKWYARGFQEHQLDFGSGSWLGSAKKPMSIKVYQNLEEHFQKKQEKIKEGNLHVAKETAGPGSKVD